jgi:hypothetical protein
MTGAAAKIHLVINCPDPGYFGPTPICCFLCVNCINHLCVNEK